MCCSGAGVVSFPSDISGNCDPGFYCVQGINTPRPSQNFTGIGGVCPPGAYCPEASPEPLGCPSGTFSNVSQLQLQQRSLVVKQIFVGVL